jgi:hypothetical protein
VDHPAGDHFRRRDLVFLPQPQERVNWHPTGTDPWHQAFISRPFDAPDRPIDTNPALRWVLFDIG